MSTILSALDPSSIRRPRTLHPTQTLAYPVNWTANHLHFAPTRPGWVRAAEQHADDIYLIFAEPYLDAWVALVARRERSPNEEASKHRFEEPYYLFTPQSYSTTAIHWGESARRLAYVANNIGKILLVGACMPSDPGLFVSYTFNVKRVTKSWSIPEGGIDYAKGLAFDEYTGISAISMASGRLWVIDPVFTAKRMQITVEGLKTVSIKNDIRRVLHSYISQLDPIIHIASSRPNLAPPSCNPMGSRNANFCSLREQRGIRLVDRRRKTLPRQEPPRLLWRSQMVRQRDLAHRRFCESCAFYDSGLGFFPESRDCSSWPETPSHPEGRRHLPI